MIDLREQATARFGLQAKSLGLAHIFLIGSFLNGHPWAMEIHNLQPSTAISGSGVQPGFNTAAEPADSPRLMVGGAGRTAVIQSDRDLLLKISKRKPRNPEQYMEVLGAVNQRAAKSGGLASASISEACTVAYLPPAGDDVKWRWFGSQEEEYLAPAGLSQIRHGIDIHEAFEEWLSRPMGAVRRGEISEQEIEDRLDHALKMSVEAKGRPGLRE